MSPGVSGSVSTFLIFRALGLPSTCGQKGVPRSQKPGGVWEVEEKEVCDEGTSSALIAALLFGRNAQTLCNNDTYAESTSLIQTDCRYLA